MSKAGSAYLGEIQKERKGHEMRQGGLMKEETGKMHNTWPII
jgi:hypothetical protein